MSAGSFIRFVGGPWHNRVEWINNLAPAIILRSKEGIPCGIETIYKDELYHLVQFVNYYNTKYLQYVHSTLIRGKRVDPRCYSERLATFRISRREVQERIRKAVEKHDHRASRAAPTAPAGPDSYSPGGGPGG